MNILPHSFNEAKECHLATQHHHVRASPWGSANTQTMLRTHLYRYQIDLTWIWQIQSWDVRGRGMQINEEKQREHEVRRRTGLPHCWRILLSTVSFKFTLLPKPKLVPKNLHTNFMWPKWNLTAFNANLHVKTSPPHRQEKKHFLRTFFWMKDVSLTRGLYFMGPALLSTGCGQRFYPPPQSLFSPLRYECGLQRRVTTTI